MEEVSEDEDELSDELIEKVVPVMGPILLAAGIIEEDDLQYTHEAIDWGATLNDIVAFLSTKEKKLWMRTIEKELGK